MSNDFFSGLLASISERGRTLLRRAGPSDARQDASDLIELCEALLSGAGEASGTAIAREVLDRYHDLDEAGRISFFETLARSYGPDQEKLQRRSKPGARGRPATAPATCISRRSRGGRNCFGASIARRAAPRELVALRADLLDVKDRHKDLAALDRDVVHLLSSWFNRGFLVLRKIDWSTPAIVLEKIIRYEAVHEIRDWDDLRRRIDPVDRRCYGFFHPALVDEPLIFVEVALTEQIPGAIAPLLAEDRQPVPIERARTAVFYSISNCQRGLGGITFGNFLIKQVVEELRRELPKLENFVTLSPVPGFMQWLKDADDLPLTEEDRRLFETLEQPGWVDDPQLAAQLRSALEPLAAYYFLKARTRKGRLIDSVARFHLGNGARLERINWLGDISPKGLARIRRHHGELPLPSRGHREEPRSLCQRRRGRCIERGEETAEDRRPAAARHAVVVKRQPVIAEEPRPCVGVSKDGSWRKQWPHPSRRRPRGPGFAQDDVEVQIHTSGKPRSR